MVLEKSNKLLGKVRISGGGRCNVTHHCTSPAQLAKHYPRGGAWLKKRFAHFQATDMLKWLADRGVSTKMEADGRIFPVSDRSDTIVHCLLAQAQHHGVQFATGVEVAGLEPAPKGWRVHTREGVRISASAVLVATGGYPKPGQYAWLGATGHSLVPPVPSLFTFNIPDSPLAGLEGLAAPDAHVSLAGTDFGYRGPVLITHWGLSGPAVLKASAWGARWLAQAAYRYTVRVQWLAEESAHSLEALFAAHRRAHPRMQVENLPPEGLPRRLWERLCALAEVPAATVWGQLPARPANRLLNLLLNTQLPAHGKTTYKDEFVTAGGIPLDEVKPHTLESTRFPGLYFAGEVLDVDGITGGFNFQAAWTTGWLAAHGIAQQLARSAAPALPPTPH
jgi:predicted Rossmann fold flavoprotein